MRRPALLLLAAVTLAAALPFAAALLSSSLAAALDCRLDEGSAQACLLGGRDIGGDLSAAWVLGIWLSLPALPVLLVAVVAWIVVALLHRRSATRPRASPRT